MAIHHRSIIAAAFIGWIVLCPDCPLPANENAAVEASSAEKLALEQQGIADKYNRLEQVMLQMAELSAQTDPRRAALLKKAIAQSKEQLIGVRIERLVEFLEKDQLSQALENQAEVDQELRGLLELLLSENRAKRIQSEKARIRQYLKQLGGILKQEKDVQARTVNRDDSNRLAGEQGKIAEKTGSLAKDIKSNEEGGSQKAEEEKGKPSDDKNKSQGQGEQGRAEDQGQTEGQAQQSGDQQ